MAATGTGNTGARDASYADYDNDANFDARLNSSSAEYVRNLSLIHI